VTHFACQHHGPGRAAGLQSRKQEPCRAPEPDLPLELAVGAEHDEVAAARVEDRDTPIDEDREGEGWRRGPPEPSRPLSQPPEPAHRIPLQIDDHEARGLGIEHVQVARSVEVDIGNPSEGVPVIALQRPHPVQLLESGLEEAVLGG